MNPFARHAYREVRPGQSWRSRLLCRLREVSRNGKTERLRRVQMGTLRKFRSNDCGPLSFLVPIERSVAVASRFFSTAAKTRKIKKQITYIRGLGRLKGDDSPN